MVYGMASLNFLEAPSYLENTGNSFVVQWFSGQHVNRWLSIQTRILCIDENKKVNQMWTGGRHSTEEAFKLLIWPFLVRIFVLDKKLLTIVTNSQGKRILEWTRINHGLFWDLAKIDNNYHIIAHLSNVKNTMVIFCLENHNLFVREVAWAMR